MVGYSFVCAGSHDKVWCHGSVSLAVLALEAGHGKAPMRKTQDQKSHCKFHVRTPDRLAPSVILEYIVPMRLGLKRSGGVVAGWLSEKNVCRVT